MSRQPVELQAAERHGADRSNPSHSLPAGTRAAVKAARRMQEKQRQAAAAAQAQAERPKSMAETNPYMDFPTRIYLFFTDMLKKLSDEAETAEAPHRAAVAVNDIARAVNRAPGDARPAAAAADAGAAAGRAFVPGPGYDQHNGKCVPCMATAQRGEVQAGDREVSKADLRYSNRYMGENLAAFLRDCASPRRQAEQAHLEHSMNLQRPGGYMAVLNRNPAEACLGGPIRSAQQSHGYSPTSDDAGAYATMRAGMSA